MVDELRCDLEHDSAAGRAHAVGDAATTSSAVEIARPVPEQACQGFQAVRSACERVQHRLRAGRVQLEQNPTFGTPVQSMRCGLFF